MPRAAEVRSASGEMEDARTYAIWAAMERSFVLGGEAGSQRLLLPRHSRARFLELVVPRAPPAARISAPPPPRLLRREPLSIAAPRPPPRARPPAVPPLSPALP